jgi:hypothetical protein
MNRIKEIYNEIVAEKDGMSSLAELEPAQDNAIALLSELNSGSKVAIWRLLFWLIAFAHYLHELVIAKMIDKAPIGSLPWLVDLAKNYQFGVPLIFQEGSYVYENPNDSTYKIITQAAAIESPQRVVIKLATGTTPNLQPLNSIQYDAFRAYFNLKGIPGVNYGFINEIADILVAGFDVFYDPLLLDANGELLLSPGAKPVNDIIESYVQELPFNGTLELTKLTNAVKQHQAVKNIVLKFANARYGSITPIDIYNSQGQSYIPFAGYLRISTVPGETLADTVNYIPYND